MRLHHNSGAVDRHTRMIARVLALSREEYRDHITGLLQEQLDHAMRHVPYYRVSVGSVDVRKTEDPRDVLAHFPLLSRSVLQERWQDLCADDSDREPVLRRISSGSTGAPAMVLKPVALFEYYSAVILHKMMWHGWTPFDVYFVMHGGGIGNITPGVSVGRLYDLIRQGRPNILYCYPSYLLVMMDAVPLKDLKELSLKYIGTHSEQTTQSERDTIGEAFACPVYDDYGATEVGPIAFQCEEKQYHVVDHNVYVEILNEGGERVSQGERGEIVVTDLRNRIMPLVRYRTGDYGTESVSEGCSCVWRNTRKVGCIEGRVEDAFRLPSGARVPSGQLIGPLGFCSVRVVRRWQIIQEEVDAFRVVVEQGSMFQQNAVEELVARFRKLVGEPVRVTIEYVGENYWDTGKRRVFRSMV